MAKRGLTEEEGKTEEKSLSKGINEQKQVLQVPQSDIRDIKESLQEIKDVMEGTNFFSMWSTVGSIAIATGILGIGMGASLWSKGSSVILILFLAGILLFCSGGVMIYATSDAGTDVKKYPNKLGIEALTELWYNNRWLLLAILLGFAAVIVLSYDVLSTLYSVLRLFVLL